MQQIDRQRRNLVDTITNTRKVMLWSAFGLVYAVGTTLIVALLGAATAWWWLPWFGWSVLFVFLGLWLYQQFAVYTLAFLNSQPMTSIVIAPAYQEEEQIGLYPPIPVYIPSQEQPAQVGYESWQS